MNRTRIASVLLLAVGIATSTVSFAQPADAAVETVLVEAVARFNFDDSAISAPDRAAMMAEVAKMGDVTWQTVTAVGHTDSVGSQRYNQRLSLKRASAVRAYLMTKGIDPSMIRTEGKAASEPLADNATDEGRATNRRAEIRFQGIRTAAK